MNVPINILQRTTSDPKIIIWAQNAFICPSGSSTLEKGVTFGIIESGGIGSSMIACENDWGLSLVDMSREQARVLLLTCLCMVLRNSSFVFYSSSCWI